jgi:hypothetical protein
MTLKKTTIQDEIPIPTDEHFMFYKFLFLSPSYYLAHRISIGENDRFIPHPPGEFHLVMKTYKKCGDVWEIGFDNWWENVGHKVLAIEKKPAIYKFDDSLSEEKIIENFKEALKNKKRIRGSDSKKKIHFIKNKIRYSTLVERYLLVTEHATNVFYDYIGYKQKSGDPPHWFTAYSLRNEIPSLKQCAAVKDVERYFKYETVLEERSKEVDGEIVPEMRKVRKFIGFRKLRDDSSKRYLTMLISKQLKEALNLSENAARGRFPCIDKVEDCLEFDYPDIRLLLGDIFKRFMAGGVDFKKDNPGLQKFFKKMKTWDKLLKKFSLIEQRQLEAIKKEYEEKLAKAWEANVKLASRSK